MIVSENTTRKQVWAEGQLIAMIEINNLFSMVYWLNGKPREREMFSDDTEGLLAKAYIQYRSEIDRTESFNPFSPFRSHFSEDLEQFYGKMFWDHSENYSGLSSYDFEFQIYQTSIQSHFSGHMAELYLTNKYFSENRDILAKYHADLNAEPDPVKRVEIAQKFGVETKQNIGLERK